MTSSDAYKSALEYLRLNIRNIYIFLAVSLLFGGWMILSPDINETDPYADQRKIMAIGYTLISLVLMILTLKLMGRANAAIRYAKHASLSLKSESTDLKPAPDSAQTLSPEETRLYRPISTLWALFPMTAIIIVVNYIILIYAVDGGLF